ncbi:MAG: thioredoxin family protein [Desulfobacterales bacterium]|nr:thioredoxin family protein [Desulfobacterales bacterium]
MIAARGVFFLWRRGEKGLILRPQRRLDFEPVPRAAPPGRRRGRLLAGLLLWTLLTATAAVAGPPPGLLAPGAESELQTVSIRTAWSADRARPGDSLLLAVELEIRDGFHLIADAAQVAATRGFTPFPTRIRLLGAPEGIAAESPRYPRAAALKADFAEGSVMTFAGRTVVLLPVRLAPEAVPGEAVLRIEVGYQACAATWCEIPQTTAVEALLSVAPPGEAVTATHAELFAAALRQSAGGQREDRVRFDLFGWGFSLDAASGSGLLLLVAAAAFGGVLLNFTPCVLPLIPIKIFSMSQAAARPGRLAALGASTFCGITAFWLALGLLVSAASGFTSTHQLFNYPLFTIGVGAVIAAMALALLGGGALPLPAFIYAFHPAQNTLAGAFGIGILTAILSTPCTAPFMGAAAAWAVTQAPAATLLTFAAVGAGMGLPYLVLAAFPRLVRRMPRSGPVSDLPKQVMAIFMLAAAAYFAGIGWSVLATEPGSPPSQAYWWPVMALCAAAGVWAGWRAARLCAGTFAKGVWLFAAVLALSASLLGGFRLTDRGPVAWADYTPERLELALREQRAVLMIFTAEWCLNCKALEHSVWSDRELAHLIARARIAPLRIDLTGENPAGKAKLREMGSLTIPFLAVLAGDGRAVFTGDFYTAEQVGAALRRALNPIGS